MKVSEQHHAALLLMQEENFVAAAEKLRELRRGGEKSWLFLNDLALCEFMLDRGEEAGQILSAALAEKPGNGFLLVNKFYVEAAEIVRKQPPPDPLSKVRKLVGQGPEAPRVSVVMPTFNRPDLIRESVMSVFQQTMPDWELIVVNDGGDTAVEQTLAQFLKDRRVRYVLAEHGGLSSARNVGLALAKGEYLTQLDDDDIFYPEHLATVLSAFQENPEYKVIYTDFYRALQEKEGEQWVTRKRQLDFSHEFSREALRYGNYIPVCNLTHHRETLETVGFYNEHILRAMDWEYFIRLAKKYDFLHLDRVTGEFRQRSDRSQMTRSFDLPRNYYRNLVSFLHGFFPLTGLCFLENELGSGPRLLRALSRLLARDEDDFFMQRMELRKLLSEPYYAMFYTLGKRVAEEGDKKRARQAFLAALSLDPLEPRVWMRCLSP